MFSLLGKVALVTGASRGIAICLVKQGADVQSILLLKREGRGGG